MINKILEARRLFLVQLNLNLKEKIELTILEIIVKIYFFFKRLFDKFLKSNILK